MGCVEPLLLRQLVGRTNVRKSATEFLAPDRILDRSRLQIRWSRAKVGPLGLRLPFSVNHCELRKLDLSLLLPYCVPLVNLRPLSVNFNSYNALILLVPIEST
jgi:hypothetical protein